MHLEFVVEFKDGTRDWVDPIVDPETDIIETDTEITVCNGYYYTFKKSEIAKWIVRPYTPETTYDEIGED